MTNDKLIEAARAISDDIKASYTWPVRRDLTRCSYLAVKIEHLEKLIEAADEIHVKF